ncbi:hypothetical protein GCM10020254_16030 [Streptomyces goshikiensis]
MPLLDPTLWQDGPTLTGGTAPVVEPATGRTLATIGLAAPADVAEAAVRARAAQDGWGRATHLERAAVLRRAGDLFAAHADELREWIVRESGSIPGKGDFELHVAAQECYEAAALASRPVGQVLSSEAPRLSFTRRVPAGVVGVIAPFNAPLILSIRSVAPALALGNAVLLKPDRRTAVCGGLALAAVFAAAGLPAGLLQVLPGGGETGGRRGRRPPGTGGVLHRIHGQRPRRRRTGGPSPQARAPGAGRQLRPRRTPGRGCGGPPLPRPPGAPSSTRARSA